MGGGHGPVIQGNPNNIEEADADLSLRIRSIELIKHNPQLFYLDFFNWQNHYEIAGGAKTVLFGLIGGQLSLMYFMASRRSQPYNFYVNLHQGFFRYLAGFGVGGAFGFNKFGDRQRLHNAWVAERLRRRYPESKDLHATNLWQYKGVAAAYSFYNWR